MFFLKKWSLEKKLIGEIKNYANVDEFPPDDAKNMSQLLLAYNRGEEYVNLAIMMYLDTLEKYPKLADNWDNLMIKYKKLGLFPQWNVNPIE